MPAYLFHAIGTHEYMWTYDKPPALPSSVPLLLRIDISLNQLKLSRVQTTKIRKDSKTTRHRTWQSCSTHGLFVKEMLGKILTAAFE